MFSHTFRGVTRMLRHHPVRHNLIIADCEHLVKEILNKFTKFSITYPPPDVSSLFYRGFAGTGI